MILEAADRFEESESIALILAMVIVDVIFQFHKSRFGGVHCFVCRLQWVYQSIYFEVLVELGRHAKQFQNVAKLDTGR